jgi:hypothetical protein
LQKLVLLTQASWVHGLGFTHGLERPKAFVYKGQACPAHQSTLELQWLVVPLRVAGALVPSAWVLSSRRQQQREYGQYGRVKDVVSSSQLTPTLQPSVQRLREYGLSNSSGRACGRLRPTSREKALYPPSNQHWMLALWGHE